MKRKEESKNVGLSTSGAIDTAAAPAVVDRATFQAQLDALRVREKAHTHEGDAIAATRRRLPMVEVDPTTTLIGPHGPVTLLDGFEGRRQLIAYYFMWHTGHPAPEQCEGCTWVRAWPRDNTSLIQRLKGEATRAHAWRPSLVKRSTVMAFRPISQLRVA
jgi:Bacterial protein of unknown function (DUF899)